MLLLDAVNQVLRSVGQAPVAAINSAHPEIAAILDEINRSNEVRQRRGWWFNKYTTDLVTNILPADTVFARPVKRSLDFYPKGGVLFDRKTGLPVSGAVPEVEIQTLVLFENLPDEFADYVATAASLAYATAYDADELHLQALTLKLKDTEVLIHRLHIRYYEIAKVSKRLQGRGWWFNVTRRLLSPGMVYVEIPESFLFVKPLTRSLDYFPRGGLLIDRATNLPVEHAVECEVREYIEDYDSLPQSFQDYVSAVAELERAQDFLPESSSIPRLQADMEQARRNCQQDHIKYAAVNLFGIPSVGNSLARSWGFRYKV